MTIPIKFQFEDKTAIFEIKTVEIRGREGSSGNIFAAIHLEATFKKNVIEDEEKYLIFWIAATDLSAQGKSEDAFKKFVNTKAIDWTKEKLSEGIFENCSLMVYSNGWGEKIGDNRDFQKPKVGDRIQPKFKEKKALVDLEEKNKAPRIIV